jgi:tetratricopeptide (TPR) repeat protein
MLERYYEAIKSLDEAIRIDPTFIGFWYNKGVILRKLKKYDETQ